MVAILLFAQSAGDVRMSEASEESTGAVVILPSQCAIALIEAIGDFEECFASQPTSQDTNFKEHFQNTYGKIKCSERDDRILIYIYPSEPGIRGSGIRYYIDKKDFRVLERIFDR